MILPTMDPALPQTIPAPQTTPAAYSAGRPGAATLLPVRRSTVTNPSSALIIGSAISPLPQTAGLECAEIGERPLFDTPAREWASPSAQIRRLPRVEDGSSSSVAKLNELPSSDTLFGPQFRELPAVHGTRP